MNATMGKFGYPATLLKELEHWAILLRPAQPTLGSLVLAARSEATAYHQLPRDAFAEQADAVGLIEHTLANFCRYERINYLMLMMVDPHVHFHVIPRYSEPRTWSGVAFPDSGWPAAPQLGSAVELTEDQGEALRNELRTRFG